MFLILWIERLALAHDQEMKYRVQSCRMHLARVCVHTIQIELVVAIACDTLQLQYEVEPEPEDVVVSYSTRNSSLKAVPLVVQHPIDK